MTDPSVPDDILALAEERSAARAARDWTSADELKTRIETAGWRVVDDGLGYALLPARPADVVEEDRTLYGAVDSVPSRLDEAAACTATVVLVAQGHGVPVENALDALAAHRPADTQVLVVADRAAVVAGPVDEVVRAAGHFSAGEALQSALRRATGEVIVVLEPELVPDGDVVSPLVARLRDPGIAVAALEGLSSNDLHRYQPSGTEEATTIRSGCYAFRRSDLIERGPVDARLQLRSSVAVWIGLLLRDEGADAPPRRAAIMELPAQRTTDAPDAARAHVRQARRDGYRIAGQFRDHGWLASEEPPHGRLIRDRADEHEQQHDDGQAGHAEDP